MGIIKIININSTLYAEDGKLNGIPIDELEIDLDLKNQDFWQKYKNHSHSPIFLVNEVLMDFIYPPFKRRCLNEGKLKNIIDEIDEKSLKEFNFDGLNDDTKKLVAFGVYCSEHECEKEDESKLGKEIYDLYKKKIENYEKFNCIFICPERINTSTIEICDESKETFNQIQTKKAFEICFKKVVLHEIAHGYMDQVSNSIKKSNNWYKETWGKIIEESFANLLAIKQFKEQEQLQIIEKFTNKQPIEYQLYRFWMKKGKNVNFLIRCWLNEEIPIFENYYIEFGSLFSKSKILKIILEPYVKLSKLPINYTFYSNVKSNPFINNYSKDNEFFWRMIVLSILVYAEELIDNWEIIGIYESTNSQKPLKILDKLVKADAEVKKNDPSSFLKIEFKKLSINIDSSGNLEDSNRDKITLKVKKM